MAPRSRRRGIRQSRLIRWSAGHQIETVGLVGGVVFVLLCFTTGLLISTDAWAALGQWIGGFGTIVAVVAALFIARGEARRAAAERRRQDIGRAAEQRATALANARLITAEVHVLEIWDMRDYPPNWYPDVFVRITNRGTNHILNPKVDALIPSQEGPSITWKLADIEDIAGTPYLGPPAVLAAGDTEAVPIDIISAEPQSERWSTVAVISYTTADGIRWRRTGPGGEPSRVPEDDEFEAEGPEWYRNW